MAGLFSGRTLVGFGPHQLEAGHGPSCFHQVQARPPGRLRALVRQECPRRPGVYGMLDARGELIYIGKAKCLRGRLLTYFRPKSRDPKAGRILGATRTIVWEEARSEFAALLRELELIRRWRPRFNVHGQPTRRRRTFVCLGRKPAPYVFLSTRPPAGVLACYGPVPAGRRAREAARRLNDCFRLRDCPQSQEMVFADQGDLFPILRAAGCLRYEIATCSGPCAAACLRTEYAAQVRAARAFLDGTSRTPLDAFEKEMAMAAAALEFERAEALRDKLESLHWLFGHLERLRQAREQHSFVYSIIGHDGQETWYAIHCGRVLAALPAPADPVNCRRGADLIDKVYQNGNRRAEVSTAEHLDGVFLVVSWFRRHPQERNRTHDPKKILKTLKAACQMDAQGASAGIDSPPL